MVSSGGVVQPGELLEQLSATTRMLDPRIHVVGGEGSRGGLVCVVHLAEQVFHRQAGQVVDRQRCALGCGGVRHRLSPPVRWW
jgi:hypothetical protein